MAPSTSDAAEATPARPRRRSGGTERSVRGKGHSPDRLPPPQLWEGPAMRAALAAHDLGSVFRQLQAAGFSQRAIGTLTGTSQPEVCGVIHGRRIRSYDVLARAAAGLGIPPGYLGLAWCERHECQRPPADHDGPGQDHPDHDGTEFGAPSPGTAGHDGVPDATGSAG